MGVVFFCLTGGILTYLFVNSDDGAADTAIEEEAPGDSEARVSLGLGLGLGRG